MCLGHSSVSFLGIETRQLAGFLQSRFFSSHDFCDMKSSRNFCSLSYILHRVKFLNFKLHTKDKKLPLIFKETGLGALTI